MEKFGKSCKEILRLKESFFKNNDEKLRKLKNIAELYRSQPKRNICKICGYRLGKSLFSKWQIDYIECDNCGHLNGIYEDTAEFAFELYSKNDGEEYASNYEVPNHEDFYERVKAIYSPKANFLVKALQETGESLENISVVDVGCGSGFFLFALKELGINDIQGYEVSKYQADIGNKFIGEDIITNFTYHELIEVTTLLSSNVITLIGVLEHLINPLEFFKAISKNPNIQYIFMSVPLFSFSVFIEILFPKVMPRHLAGGHTHLFTKDSINYIANKYGFNVVSEWWFGSDMMDLYRNFSIALESNSDTMEASKSFHKKMVSMIDELQYVIDKHRESSEVHILLQKKK